MILDDIVELKKRNPFLDDDIPDLWSRLNYINKKQVIDEKILVILPCNPGGANHGSYFMSGDWPYRVNNWRKTDIWLRPLREQIYFAAHSCVEFKYNDGKGALVFEHEMIRVKNDFDYGKPGPDVFTFDPTKNGFLMTKMVEDLKKGTDRAMRYGFERIISIQSPLFYKMGFSKAVQDLGLWDKVTLIDTRMGTFEYFMKMINCVLFNNITGIVYDRNWSYKFNQNRLNDTPIEFQYCFYDNYVDITDKIEKLRIKGDSFEHFLPILNRDRELNLDNLIEKYKLPYRTKLYPKPEIIYA